MDYIIPGFFIFTVLFWTYLMWEKHSAAKLHSKIIWSVCAIFILYGIVCQALTLTQL